MKLTRWSNYQAEEDIGDLRGQVDLLNEAHTQADATNAPNTPASGIIAYSSGGQQKYASADGNTYNTGRATFYSTASQTISSATPGVAVTPMSCPVAAGAYRVRVRMSYLENATAAQTPSFYFAGPTTSTFEITSIIVSTQGTAAVSGNRMTAIGVGGAQAFNQYASLTRIVEMDGVIVFTASGTLTFMAFTSLAADTYNIQAGSYMEVMPVS